MASAGEIVQTYKQMKLVHAVLLKIRAKSIFGNEI